MRSKLALLTVAGLAFAFAGCATTSTLGSPPSDAELRNDGTEAAQDKLYDEYAIEYESGDFVRSAAEGHVEGNTEVVPRASAFSDDARAYIEGSDDAVLAYDFPLLWAHRTYWNIYPKAQAAGMVSSVFAGAAAGAGAGVLLGAGLRQDAAETSDFIGFGILGSMVGVFACTSSCALCFAACGPKDLGLLKYALAGVVRQGYVSVAEAYNRDLSERIEAARGQRPAPAEGTAESPAVDEAAPAPAPGVSPNTGFRY